MLQRPSYFQIAWAYVASIGWYAVALLGIAWYTYPYVQDKYIKWKMKRDEKEYAAKYHKNPDLLQERLSGLEAARQKMQEEYQKAALIAKQKEEEKKQKKKEEISNLLGGHRIGEASTSGEQTSKSLKPDYKPLMGDSSRGYRPPKRSCCKNGGCG